MKSLQNDDMTLDELCVEVKKLTDSRRCFTIHGAVGTLCEDVPIANMVQWLSRECYSEGAIRYYLQEQISGAVINKIRYEEGVKLK